MIPSFYNLKHKAMLMLMYSDALRVGEVVKLKPGDIDCKRILIHINGLKGRKNRYTLLLEKVLYVLRHMPQKWLFERTKQGGYIIVRSIQKIFENACKTVGLKRDIKAYKLMQSFATHLLKSGTHLRYIHKTLYHKNSKITEIYTHVSTKSLAKIKSSLDSLDLNEKGSK